MSRFNNRSEFISAASSEKITLAAVNARKRLYIWTDLGSGLYSKVVPNFTAKLHESTTELTKVDSQVLVTEGTFFYDIENSKVYAHFNGSVAPNSIEVIATYTLFFSTKGIHLTHNLKNISKEVFWDGRISSSPGYKHKIGIDQGLTSLVGEGTLKLKNEDGGLDNVFDRLIFENQDVVIYSWNPQLCPEDSRVVYRGRVTNKAYDINSISLKIKDQLFALLDSPALEPYTEDDNVSDSSQGQYKRRVYGRVDGLRCQSIDQIAEGIPLTGTVSVPAGSTILTGLGTTFLSQVTGIDSLIIGTQDFSIESIDSDTQITLSDEADYAASGLTALLVPESGTSLANRSFLSAGHICAEVQHTVVNSLQFNRIEMDDTSGFFPGDFIEFVGTGERIEIRNVAPGNIVVLQQNVVTLPSVGSAVIRRPIQEVYVRSRRVNSDDYTIFNNSTGCGIILDSDVEFNLARSKNTVFTATFTTGSRVVDVTTSEVSLGEIFNPGDFIKPEDISFSVYYKISYIDQNTNQIFLTETFSEATNTDVIEYKAPDYIEDDTPISVNILGRTTDGTANGTWITTAAQAERDLIKDIQIEVVNEASFIEGEQDATQLISMAIPLDFGSKSLPKVKELVDLLNKSVHSSLTLDNDLLMKYQVLNVYSGEDLKVIRDHDVISWKLKANNGKTFRQVLANYRFTDTDLSSLETGNKFLSFSSDYVDNYIGTKKTSELNIYLYNQFEAEIAAHRHLYYNRLSVSTLTIVTDLRLEDTEIGDVVIVDFDRMYKRFGDADHEKKTMLVIGKSLTGERTELILSDLGNTFNTSSYITENTAPDYIASSSDEKMLHGFITDNQGITEDVEDTAGVYLIS